MSLGVDDARWQRDDVGDGRFLDKDERRDDGTPLFQHKYSY